MSWLQLSMFEDDLDPFELVIKIGWTKGHLQTQCEVWAVEPRKLVGMRSGPHRAEDQFDAAVTEAADWARDMCSRLIAPF